MSRAVRGAGISIGAPFGPGSVTMTVGALAGVWGVEAAGVGVCIIALRFSDRSGYSKPFRQNATISRARVECRTRTDSWAGRIRLVLERCPLSRRLRISPATALAVA